MNMAQAVVPTAEAQIDQLCINTIRPLSMDAVQQAKSGHPSTPMALAPLVYTIWNRVMRFDPADPIWFNRDRFVAFFKFEQPRQGGAGVNALVDQG